MRKNTNGVSEPKGTLYEIRVEGLLSNEWSSWFEGLAIRQEIDPKSGLTITVFSGQIPDQPALHGILDIIRDLNLELISVLTMPENP